MSLKSASLSGRLALWISSRFFFLSGLALMLITDSPVQADISLIWGSFSYGFGSFFYCSFLKNASASASLRSDSVSSGYFRFGFELLRLFWKVWGTYIFVVFSTLISSTVSFNSLDCFRTLTSLLFATLVSKGRLEFSSKIISKGNR